MSTFLRIRASVRLARSLPPTLHYRSLSSRYNSENAPDSLGIDKQYEQACERSGRLEQQWIQNRKDIQEASGNSPITFPSYFRDLNDEFGPFDMDVRTEAQRAVERHSKYAWVSSFLALLPRTTLMQLSSPIIAGTVQLRSQVCPGRGSALLLFGRDQGA